MCRRLGAEWMRGRVTTMIINRIYFRHCNDRGKPYTSFVNLRYEKFASFGFALAITLASVPFMHGTTEAKSGCCSSHGGVNYCGSNGKYICNDGTASPTCGCSAESNSVITPSVKIEYATPAKDSFASTLIKSQSVTGASCRNRFGEGAMAGKGECVCQGGYKMNAAKTKCESDGTDKSAKSEDRLKLKIEKANAPSKKNISSAKAFIKISSSEQKKTSSASCVIKGNINAEKEKIYHLPSCPNFNQTIIDMTKGERIFCSEADAQKAGWRKSKNCPK